MEEIKDNVCVEEIVAEQANDAVSEQENGSTAMGKFKSVDALLQAYGALQAEFTRRSQKLKKLEREAEILKKNAASSEKETGAGNEAEKLRQRAEERRAESEKFDRFVSELEAPRAATESAEPADPPTPLQQERGTETNPPVAENRGDFSLSSDALYEQVNRDESVRLKIIGEYLSSLSRAGAPLMQGGAGTLTAPPIKARSVTEAGNMALRFFQKDGSQA